MSYGKCYNCGADEGLHHYETMQCPKNGIEETRFDELNNKYYPQRWEETVFEEAERKQIELAAPKMLEALEAVRRHGLIEKDGYDTVVRMVGESIHTARKGVGRMCSNK